MTIAAGFKFDGGIFLCADSQFSYGGVAKTRGDKVMSGGFGKRPAKIGFAFAGNVPRARAAIRNIVMGIDGLSPRASSHDIFEAIEQAMQKSYKAVFRHPTYNPQTQEGPHFWLLICVWVEGVGSALLKTDEDVVTEVRDFDCAGSGDYLFRYILDDVYRRDMELQEVITLVTYAFKEIKGYDPNVGFNSEFLAFFDGKKSFSRIAGYDVDHMENFGSLTKREFFKYMFVMADLRSTDEQIVKAKQLFEDNLINLRRRYAEDKTHRRAIMKLVNILTTTEKGSITFTFPTKR